MIGHSGPAGHGGYFRICKAVTTRSTFPLVHMLLFATILQVYPHRPPLIRLFNARSAADSVSCG